MNKLALLAATFAAIALGGSANAADMPLKAPPIAPAPMWSWTGWYVGLHAGYGWGDPKDDVSTLPSPAAFNEIPFTISIRSRGFLGGGQFGYNWQSGPVVAGFEADISGAHISGTGNFGPIIAVAPAGFAFPGSVASATDTVRWLTTERLRLGYTPTGQLLLYATGGLAVGGVSYSSVHQVFPGVPASTFNASDSATRVGWTAGGGAEWAIDHKWSIKAEYLFFDLGHHTLTALRAVPFGPPDPFAVVNNFETRGNIVRAGVNYKLN